MADTTKPDTTLILDRDIYHALVVAADPNATRSEKLEAANIMLAFANRMLADASKIVLDSRF